MTIMMDAHETCGLLSAWGPAGFKVDGAPTRVLHGDTAVRIMPSIAGMRPRGNRFRASALPRTT